MPQDTQILRSATLTEELTERLCDALARTAADSGGGVLSERKLAEAHGVSRTTVRRALGRLVAQGRLISVPRRGYQLVRPRVELKTGVVALIRRRVKLPKGGTGFQANLLNGLRKATAKTGRDLLLIGREDSDAANIVRHLRERSVIGAIMDCDDVALARGLRNGGIPVVLVDEADPERESVLQDNFGGAHLATGELIAKGHRRIACLLRRPLRKQWLVHYRERLGGYLAAMSEAGLPVHEQWLIGPLSGVTPGRALVEVSSEADGPTAAVVLWSELLTEVGAALRAAKRNVELNVWWGGAPQGRDAWRSAFPELPVPDGVAWNVDELARRALERLEDLCHEPNRAPARTQISVYAIRGDAGSSAK